MVSSRRNEKMPKDYTYEEARLLDAIVKFQHKHDVKFVRHTQVMRIMIEQLGYRQTCSRKKKSKSAPTANSLKDVT